MTTPIRPAGSSGPADLSLEEPEEPDEPLELSSETPWELDLLTAPRTTPHFGVPVRTQSAGLEDVRALSDAELDTLDPTRRARLIAGLCKTANTASLTAAKETDVVLIREVAGDTTLRATDLDLSIWRLNAQHQRTRGNEARAQELETFANHQESVRAPLITEATRLLMRARDGGELEAILMRLVRTRELGLVTATIGIDRMIEIGNRYGVDFNSIAALSDTVRVRGLSRDERAAAERTFGPTLVYDAVRLHFTSGSILSVAGAMVLGNIVKIDPEIYGMRPGTTTPLPGRRFRYENIVFAHELMHVWQYQHLGTTYMARSATDQVVSKFESGSRNETYDYILEPGKSLWDYPIEAQANIIQHYARNKLAFEAGVMTREEFEPYIPYFEDMRAGGMGRAEPNPGTGLEVRCSCFDPKEHASDGGDGVAHAYGQYLPLFFKQLGGEARAAAARGDLATLATILGPVAYFAYDRGSYVLEEWDLPNTLRVSTRDVGLSLGAEWGPKLNAMGLVVDIDAQAKLGSFDLRTQLGGTTDTIGPRDARFYFGADNGEDVRLDVVGQLDRAGGYGAYTLQLGALDSSGEVRLNSAYLFAGAEWDMHLQVGQSRAGGSVQFDEVGLSGAQFDAVLRAPEASLVSSVKLDRFLNLDQARLSFSGELPAGFSVHADAGFSIDEILWLRGGVGHRQRELEARLSAGYEAATGQSMVELSGSTTESFMGYLRGTTNGSVHTVQLGLSKSF